LWADPADDHRAKQWARDLRADMQPWASGSVCLNFVGDEAGDRVVAGLGVRNYVRLPVVKPNTTPTTSSTLNHNIKPA
jgi:hypothetical protein